MNILVVTPGFPSKIGINASAKFVFNEALAYSVNDANVIVVTPHYHGALKQEPFNSKLVVKRFRYFFPTKYQFVVDPLFNTYDKGNVIKYMQIPLFFIAFIISVLKYSKNIDIIHCQWTTTVLVALPAKWLLGKKIVVTARGSDLRLMPKSLNRYIFKKVDAAIDCYGPQTWNDNMKSEFCSNYIKLPLIINPTSKNPVKLKGYDHKNQLRLIYLGRFDKIKIQDSQLPLFELVVAAAQLLKKGCNIKVAYIGDGDEEIRERLKKQIKEYGIENTVQLLGFQVNPEIYFNNFDLGVGGIAFNTVCQEFVFNGIPQVLVNNKNNIGTPWKHFDNCILIRPFSVEDLVCHIEYFYYHKNRLKQIALNAKELLNDLLQTPNRGGKIYLNSYEKIINDSKS